MRPFSSLILVLVLLALTCMSTSPARAWPNDPAGNVPLCSATDHQRYPAIASDGAGGAIVAWIDHRSGNWDIYAQRVDATGAVRWTAGGVAVCTATGSQQNAAIASDGAGGAIVTWYDQRSGLAQIYAQRVNAAGVPQWTTDGVLLGAGSGNQQAAAIVPDGSGGAIVSWDDYRSGSSWDIYAQRVNAAGTVQWATNGVAFCAATGSQTGSALAPDGAGGAIIAWNDYRSGNFDVYAQRVNAAGVAQWTIDGVAVCATTGVQELPSLVTDGAGGALVAWEDNRSGTYDIYAQRVNASGAAQWATNGVVLCNATGDQQRTAIVADAAGGAIVAWQDQRNANWDIAAQRVNASGVVQWTANGLLMPVTGDQQYPRVVTDGAGGTIITWQDGRSGTLDIYAARLTATGSAPWPGLGVALCTAVGDQQYPAIVSDGGLPGEGGYGAIVAWQDGRSGTFDIYAQRVETHGYLGPEATIVSVLDLANDQGGHVRIKWNASPLDTLPTLGISLYGVWRQVTESTAARAIAAGARRVEGDRAMDAAPGVFRVEGTGSLTTWWEGVGTVAARGDHWYTFVAETFQDSVTAGNPYTTFKVDAHASAGAVFWDSPADSGYSVDDLAPVAPALFTGNYAAGATHLHWGVNAEHDLAGYRLYRGGSAGFIPGPGNLVAAQPDTGFSDVGAAGNWYKLSAVDVHGNESGFALLTPAATSDVDLGAPPTELAFAAPSPNPARAGAALFFTMPHAGPVTLAVYDLGGRRVRTLRVGVQEAGRHEVPFDLRDGAGRRLPSGLYLVRLEVGARILTRRLTIVE